MSDVRELNTLWGVEISDIERILLSDGIWYNISKEYTGENPGNSISKRNGLGLTIYGYFGEKPQYFELRTWEFKEKNVQGKGICIRGLVNQIQLLDTNWS